MCCGFILDVVVIRLVYLGLGYGDPFFGFFFVIFVFFFFVSIFLDDNLPYAMAARVSDFSRWRR